MKFNFKIHYTAQDGTDDWFVASADTMDELREVARAGVEARNAKNPWSEEL